MSLGDAVMRKEMKLVFGGRVADSMFYSMRVSVPFECNAGVNGTQQDTFKSSLSLSQRSCGQVYLGGDFEHAGGIYVQRERV